MIAFVVALAGLRSHLPAGAVVYRVPSRRRNQTPQSDRIHLHQKIGAQPLGGRATSPGHQAAHGVTQQA